jgi:hypothetical protein
MVPLLTIEYKDFKDRTEKTIAFRMEVYYYWNQAGEGNSHQSETNLIKDP